jgi:protein-S-isoprenylcysteine O-methyltransferase Ste14
MAHYLNRSIIFPLRFPDKLKRMPLVICISAIFFNVMNGFFNGYYLGTFKPDYEPAWFYDWRFIAGISLFIAGFFINFTSDNILFNLRKGSEKGKYKIPAGGLYRWVSCPNYLGEIIEWCGWAMFTWSLPGASFALWTAANLIPRAVANHKWYKSFFPDYPKERRSLIPFVF